MIRVRRRNLELLDLLASPQVKIMPSTGVRAGAGVRANARPQGWRGEEGKDSVQVVRSLIDVHIALVVSTTGQD